MSDDAPGLIVAQRTADRLSRLEGENEWLLHQFEALPAKLVAAGVPFSLAPWPGGEPLPRNWAAQERAVDAAVTEALAQDVARRKRQAAKRAAAWAATGPDPG